MSEQCPSKTSSLWWPSSWSKLSQHRDTYLNPSFSILSISCPLGSSIHKASINSMKSFAAHDFEGAKNVALLWIWWRKESIEEHLDMAFDAQDHSLTGKSAQVILANSLFPNRFVFKSLQPFFPLLPVSGSPTDKSIPKIFVSVTPWSPRTRMHTRTQKQAMKQCRTLL